MKPHSADIRRTGESESITVLEHHPVFLYTRVAQTSAHNVIIGCLIVFDGDPLHVLKEAGRRGGSLIESVSDEPLRLTSRMRVAPPPATSTKR